MYPTASTSAVSPRPLVRDDHYQDLLLSFLRDRSAASDQRWRRWSAGLIRNGKLVPVDLLRWWTAIVEFDPVLRAHAEHPVPAPVGAVVVAGSGKEKFKTFNVSTAAAILAAAAGTPVVKGVSRSVSAVSGAADILDVLGVAPVGEARGIPQALERLNIAFVPYTAFCPGYAARYDGVFNTVSPASFFMPVATLCVQTPGFVLGLAHADVALSARALQMIRPDLTTGAVVSTDLSTGETVDEFCDVGTVRLARLDAGVLTEAIRTNAAPTRRWRTAVAHRRDHRGNASLVLDSLTGEDTPVTHLVELNAALIVSASAGACRPEEALDRVRQARRSGGARRLLLTLAEDR
jgi:anthranilate phosphoribosyltransferase